MIFWIFWCALILQRLFELQIAKRNTEALLLRGAVEHGRKHYWMLVSLHTAFLVALALEAILTRVDFHPIAWGYLALFILAQLGRVWVLKTLGPRWSTRILVLPGEPLVRSGPFQFLSHPNYWVVAVELFTFPMAFGLVRTALTFTVLNAAVLLGVRIPAESAALTSSERSSSGPTREPSDSQAQKT